MSSRRRRRCTSRTILRSLRTYRLPERPSLIWLELETRDGLIGPGETFRGAAAVETCLHEELAPFLLGRDTRHIEGISRHLLAPNVGYNSSGTEVRSSR